MPRTSSPPLRSRRCPAASVVTSPAAPPTSAQAVDRPIVAPPAFPRTRSTAPRSTRTNYAPGPKDGGVWAVVVGIDDYPGDDADLRAAVADARDVDSALAAYGVPASHRLVLLDKQATATTSGGRWPGWPAGRRPTRRWCSSTPATSARWPVTPTGTARSSTRPSWPPTATTSTTARSPSLLRGVDARSAWIGIAACYGAGFDDVLAPGRILTAAAGENDVAYENSSLGHSYMVEYMVRRAMLQGKAPASVQDAFAWARAQIARDYPNRQPAILDRSRGPIVLGRPTTPTPTPERKPSAQPPSESKEPQPDPSAPPPTTPEPKPGGTACAQVLGVSVCSEERGAT